MKQSDKPFVSGALSDYLAAIYVLSKNGENARITDIAAYLHISKPSVNRAVNSLREQGLVEHRPYGQIIITDAGRRAGSEICRKNKIIKRFLTEILHIPESRAVREAGYMEKGISSDTIDRLERLINSKTA